MKKNVLVQEALYLMEELGLEAEPEASKKKNTKSSRTDAGDEAQKVIAEWLRGLDSKFEIKTNSPGSRSNDVTVQKGDKVASIEVKSSSKEIAVYSQELKQGSNIANVIEWSQGKVENKIYL